MTVNAINSTSFTGKYQLNANQAMPNQETCLKRDALMGFWAQSAKDSDKIHQQLKDFYLSDEYKADNNKALNITFEIPDSSDADFEKSMNIVGQKFDKIV